MIAERKRQKMVVRFNGENLALYAAVGKDFGMADIKLDGKYYTTIDFSSDIAESRKLMLNLENLEDETHTLEIINKIFREGNDIYARNQLHIRAC